MNLLFFFGINVYKVYLIICVNVYVVCGFFEVF